MWQKSIYYIFCLVTGNILISREKNSWEELISVEKKLFQKNFFWQEKFYSGKNSFCFERKKFCWQEISMLNSWREIFLSEVLILEGIYSAQEFNFFWQEINVLRSLKDFCWPILLFWKEFSFCWKNWFNMLKSRKYFCWHFVFCSSKDLFLSNMKDFLIPIQNAAKTRDFLPIFRFNF